MYEQSHESFEEVFKSFLELVAKALPETKSGLMARQQLEYWGACRVQGVNLDLLQELHQIEMERFDAENSENA